MDNGFDVNTHIRLYNTLTRSKDVLSPLNPDSVRMYLCGPTVHDYAHIGNARPIIIFDVLFRLLRAKYGESHVVYVRNITDLDDKINAQAAKEGVPISTVTERTICQFHDDIAALDVLSPTFEPRATSHIQDMIELIQRILDKGFAYVANGHVFFSPDKMNEAHATGLVPRYGALSGQSLNEMLSGARVEVSPYKRSPVDFVLWKPSFGDVPGWDSPWGWGRPGWHIECSAMSSVYLGKNFDIHGGGVDLTFPHHENEIAQSCCAFSTSVLAHIWIHNGLVCVEGQKMSKSLGNFLTINDLLETWPGQVLRLQMLMTHYRQTIDWTFARCREAETILERWNFLAAEHSDAGEDEIPSALFTALCDDLNTPAALAELHRLAEPSNAKANRQLAAAGKFLGLITDYDSWKRARARQIHHPRSDIISVSSVESLILQRCIARRDGHWVTADQIRSELLKNGVFLKDLKKNGDGSLITEFEVEGLGSGLCVISQTAESGQVFWKEKEL